MIQIDDVLISFDVFGKRFVCDLPKCLGACCVEGESGAPLEDDEISIMEDVLELVKDDLSPRALEEITKQGAWIVDMDGDKVTPIIDGKECVYTYFEKDGTCKCAIEKAWAEGKTPFRKPVSCQLYPIRIQKYAKYNAMNYDTWPICHPARELGASLGVPVYQFLKEPIVRKYGEPFFNEMVVAHEELKTQGIVK